MLCHEAQQLVCDIESLLGLTLVETPGFVVTLDAIHIEPIEFLPQRCQRLWRSWERLPTAATALVDASAMTPQSRRRIIQDNPHCLIAAIIAECDAFTEESLSETELCSRTLRLGTMPSILSFSAVHLLRIR